MMSCLKSLSLCLGKPFCNNETFGQYPLQVNGYRNLDECLEGAMVEGDVELLPSDHSVKYGQEVRWRSLFAMPVTKPVK